jgi:hypothetical protein
VAFQFVDAAMCVCIGNMESVMQNVVNFIFGTECDFEFGIVKQVNGLKLLKYNSMNMSK